MHQTVINGEEESSVTNGTELIGGEQEEVDLQTKKDDSSQTKKIPVAMTPPNGNTSFLGFMLSPFTYLFGGSGNNNNTNNSALPAPSTPPTPEEAAAADRKRKQDRAIRNKNSDSSDDTVVIKRKKGSSYTHWISEIMQRFGTDASKTVSDAFKEPLEALARSPVLRTGEVIVVHSVDFESLRLDRLFKYLGFFYFFMYFTRVFLHRLFKPKAIISQTHVLPVTTQSRLAIKDS